LDSLKKRLAAFFFFEWPEPFHESVESFNGHHLLLFTWCLLHRCVSQQQPLGQVSERRAKSLRVKKSPRRALRHLYAISALLENDFSDTRALLPLS